MHMDDTEQSPHHPMFAIKRSFPVFMSLGFYSETGGAPGATRGSEEALHESVPNLRFIKSKL